MKISLMNKGSRIAFAFMALAGAALLPAASHADTTFSVNVGNLDSVIPYSNTFNTTVNGHYTLDYTFSVSSEVYESASVTASNLNSKGKPIGTVGTSPTLKLYEAGANNTWNLVPTWGSGTSSQSFYLGAGTYELAVTGSAATGKNVVSTTLSVNPAPIPAALPLFGSALVGVGLFGRRRRKDRVSA